MSKKKRLKQQKQEQDHIQKQNRLSSGYFSVNRNTWIIALAIAFVTFLIFSPSLKNEFVNWDDDHYVYENPIIQDLTADNIKHIFDPQTMVSLNYHPITILSLAINYNFSELNPQPYILTNIIFHLFNTILVFFFFYFLSNRRIWLAGIAALLFGLHPMHVESVTWVSERKDVLYAFFYFGALIAYLKYLNNKKILSLSVVFLLFLLSCLSKAMAVTLPIILILIDYFKGRRFDTKAILEKVPFLILSVIVGLHAVNLQSQGAINDFETYSIPQRIMFASYGFISYIGKLFVPINLSSYYPYPLYLDNLSPIFFIAPVIALILFFGPIIYTYRFKRSYFLPVLFGLAFFLINILLVLQFISVGTAIMADRYTYISYAGLFFIIGYFADKWITRGSSSMVEAGKWAAGAFAVFIIVISLLTFQRTQVWKNSEILWSDVINKYPETAPEAYNNRGHFYRKNQRYDEALRDYNKAISIKPNYHLAYYNRGKIFFDRGQTQEALVEYNKTLELKPDFAEAYSNRGAVYAQLGNYDMAKKDLNTAIEMNPKHPEALMNRGVINDVTGDIQGAIADYDGFLKLRPYNATILNNRGVARQKTNDHQGAIQDFTTAIQVDGSKGFYFMNRSLSYNAIGQKQLAHQDALKAREMGVAVDENYLATLR